MYHPVIGRCWHCGADLTDLDYAREATCPSCRKATHCCRNCRWYARGRPNDCAEPIAEAVSDKERSNFCGYFEASRTPMRFAAPPRTYSTLGTSRNPIVIAFVRFTTTPAAVPVGVRCPRACTTPIPAGPGASKTEKTQGVGLALPRQPRAHGRRQTRGRRLAQLLLSSSC